MQDWIFGIVALIVITLLLVPLTAMQLTDQVKWSVADFVVTGLLLFGAGSALVLLVRLTSQKYWVPIGIAFMVVVFYIWAELAVGIFSTLGS